MLPQCYLINFQALYINMGKKKWPPEGGLHKNRVDKNLMI